MPKGKQRTPEELNKKRLEIAHAAADLIFKKGFNETAVSEISAAAGIGKSTFYDFFTTKDEIILLLLDEPLAEIRTKAAAIVSGDGTVIERISRVMHMHLNVLLRDKAFIFKLSFEFQRLPLGVQIQHEAKRQAYQDLLVDLIEEGIANRSFRRVDSDMVMKSLLSILSSVVMTSRPTDTPAGMLDKALDIIFKGVQQMKDKGVNQ
jgi:AcrR family transcriptional regulator